MKLEIEVTEAEIKSAIERKIRVAIADESNSWQNEKSLKEAVRVQWHKSMLLAVEECMADSPRLREQIHKAIEAKLRAQLSLMLKPSK